LTPYHVTRSKLFVRERFGKVSLSHIDTQEIEANIEHTRFPVPDDEQHIGTADYPGPLRAADLIGQLADIDYLRKTSALFAEFQETGANKKLGYQTPDDLRAAYPAFFFAVSWRPGGFTGALFWRAATENDSPAVVSESSRATRPARFCEQPEAAEPTRF